LGAVPGIVKGLKGEERGRVRVQQFEKRRRRGKIYLPRVRRRGILIIDHYGLLLAVWLCPPPKQAPSSDRPGFTAGAIYLRSLIPIRQKPIRPFIPLAAPGPSCSPASGTTPYGR